MKVKDIINNPDNYELEEHTDGGYLIKPKKEDKGDTPEAGKLYVLEVEEAMQSSTVWWGNNTESAHILKEETLAKLKEMQEKDE